MPEYVYALHDFLPENTDEVPFKAGEQIEVIEKDDIYGDGWWQGRNTSGAVGLFPQTYTTSIPPAEPVPVVVLDPPVSSDTHTPTTLHSLREEPETISAQGSPNPEAAGDKVMSNQSDEVMKATMTDVQQAIEQLGKNDVDGARSFSFASSRDGDWTDRELESDQETDRETDVDGENWHTGARQKLAEKARRANEKAAVEQATPMRVTAPPIEVELSDESEAEEDDDQLRRSGSSYSRHHPHIIEEDEDETKASSQHVSTIVASSGPPSPIQSDPPTAVPNGTSVIHDRSDSPIFNHRQTNVPTSPIRNNLDTLAKDHASQESPPFPSRPTTIESWSSQTPSRRSSGPLPSPTASSFTSVGIEQTLTSATSASPLKSPTSPWPNSSGQQTPKLPSTPPSEWTMEEVVEWLQSKGFDQPVCDKFIEQDITGDVLLELDVELLKTEIGIPAFGKRKRIAKCIEELRTPPSVVESPQAAQRDIHHSHSWSASSAQRSFKSPLFSVPASIPDEDSEQIADAYSPESLNVGGTSETTEARFLARRGSDPGSVNGVLLAEPPGITRASSRASMIGLGINLSSKFQKSRPSQMTLSPSDIAFHANAVSQDNVISLLDEERAAVSENDSPRTSNSKNTKRRRVFGRSFESTSSKDKEKDKDSSSRNSKEVSTPVSLSSTKRELLEDASTSPPVRHRSKKSVDSNRTGDRLSLFGTTFTGPLGKTRKPPPRYSSLPDHEKEKVDKGSTGTFSKLYHYGERKVSSHRPSTADPSLKSKNSIRESKDSTKDLKELKDDKDRALLRKRASSFGETSRPLSTPGKPGLKAGQSVMEQIGTPDHEGWMRKKAESYNTWKQRYFLLKGGHLYWLRSNNKMETKIKGYLNVSGYKVIPDENIRPGSYGFKIVHDNDKTHYFSSDSQLVIREWMKALMKTSIDRDYTKPVVSSVNIPTIPLTVAQAMSPPPRPPSPTARDATQKALRRTNPNQLSSRDAQVLLMGNLPSGEMRGNGGERARIESFFTNDTVPSPIEPETPLSASSTKIPPRPSRETRPIENGRSQSDIFVQVDDGLIEWANSHLSPTLRIADASGSICGGLTLLRLAESIKGMPSSPPVPDGAFPTSPNDDKLDGLFRLFDFLLDNDVRMGSVSINDVRQGKRDKIIQLLRALKAWEDKKKAIAQSIGNGHGSLQTPGPFNAGFPCV